MTRQVGTGCAGSGLSTAMKGMGMEMEMTKAINVVEDQRNDAAGPV
jgi:hypothetical protein